VRLITSRESPTWRLSKCYESRSPAPADAAAEAGTTAIDATTTPNTTDATFRADLCCLPFAVL